MKKTHYITIIAVVLATICLVCPSCRNEEEIDYLPVYGYDSTLSASDSIFLKSWFSGFDNNYERIKADMSNQKAVVFGNEYELFYKFSASSLNIPIDLYWSSTDIAEAAVSVAYDAETGKIRAVTDYNKWYRDLSLSEKEITPCTDEELIRIATEFAEEKWPVLKEGIYDAYVSKTSIGYHVVKKVFFRRYVNGYVTSEEVYVQISQTGVVAGWGDYLKYPDGIPENILSAIETMDMELCEKSVVHYIGECAREASERNIKVERIQRTYIEFLRDGRIFVGMVPELTKNGEKYEITSNFYVPVSYDGQPSADGRETANMQNPISSGLPLKPNQTIEITSPAETEPEIVPPDTPENTDTISLDEIE